MTIFNNQCIAFHVTVHSFVESEETVARGGEGEK